MSRGNAPCWGGGVNTRQGLRQLSLNQGAQVRTSGASHDLNNNKGQQHSLDGRCAALPGCHRASDPAPTALEDALVLWLFPDHLSVSV